MFITVIVTKSLAIINDHMLSSFILDTEICAISVLKNMHCGLKDGTILKITHTCFQLPCTHSHTLNRLQLFLLICCVIHCPVLTMHCVT